MAYDEQLAERVRAIVAREPGSAEKKMFGGLAFMIDGHLAVSASGRGGLLLRCDPADTGLLVAHEHGEPFEMRGRDMTGWLHVDAAAVAADTALAGWVARGVAYARTLPPT